MAGRSLPAVKHRPESMRTGARAALSWALSLAIGGCGASVAPRSFDHSTAPTTDVTPAATARTTPLPKAMATPGFVAPGPLPAGLYGVDIGRVRFTFTIPDGWVGPPVPGFAVIKEGPTEQGGIILSFWSPANVYADVCDHRSLLDPAVGPGVGDLASAFAGQSGTEAAGPTAITVDGYHGQLVELSIRTEVADCPGPIWLWLDNDDGKRSTDSDEDNELWILDVDGERVVIDVVSGPETAEEARAELRTIFDTIQIEP